MKHKCFNFLFLCNRGGVTMESKFKHHPWCNYQSTDPKTCKLCKRLKREYPETHLSAKQLQQRYFPEVEIREFQN